MEITLGQQYSVGEKPTVILYTYINHHTGTSEKQRVFFVFAALIPPKRFDIFSPVTEGCSERLGAFCFFFKNRDNVVHHQTLGVLLLKIREASLFVGFGLKQNVNK